MYCKRCGNREIRYFYNDKGVWYCRKCVGFQRLNVNEELEACILQQNKIEAKLHLQYPLTDLQKKAVKQIELYLDRGFDVLVHAACGAGKTELVMPSIQTYLRKGKKVGFAIARRQVVLEIRERLQQAFSNLNVVAVCEGYHKQLDGDLIVCTMHQLYRYHQGFDLLIMDEVDAFPYRGNAMLEQIAKNACRGNFLYLSATPDTKLLKLVQEHKIKLVELFQRPHGYPLIVPTIYCLLPIMQYIYAIYYLYLHKKRGIQVLVFVPTISLAKKITLFMNCFFSCACFTSKTKEKEKVIDDFHQKKYDALISTTILERGITIKGIHILILHADHCVFHEASLIQMIGRVGRKLEKPTGKGVFLCVKKTKDMKACIKTLKKMNESLYKYTKNYEI